MQFSRLVLALIISALAINVGFSQHEGHDHSQHEDHSGHNHADHSTHAQEGHHDDHGEGGHHKFDPKETAFHHISDANVYSIGPFSFPLPCILYAPDEGFTFMSSGRFEPDYHGTGSKAVDGYALSMGSVVKVVDGSFPKGEVHIDGIKHKQEENISGKIGTVDYVVLQRKGVQSSP